MASRLRLQRGILLDSGGENNRSGCDCMCWDLAVITRRTHHSALSLCNYLLIKIQNTHVCVCEVLWMNWLQTPMNMGFVSFMEFSGLQSNRDKMSTSLPLREFRGDEEWAISTQRKRKVHLSDFMFPQPVGDPRHTSWSRSIVWSKNLLSINSSWPWGTKTWGPSTDWRWSLCGSSSSFYGF